MGKNEEIQRIYAEKLRHFIILIIMKLSITFFFSANPNKLHYTDNNDKNEQNNIWTWLSAAKEKTNRFLIH